jgi:hypothetical protein
MPLDWADLRLLTYIYFIKFRIAAYFGQNRTLFFGWIFGNRAREKTEGLRKRRRVK